MTGSFFNFNEIQVLKLADTLRSRTFGAGDNFEADPVTLGKRLEAICLDC